MKVFAWVSAFILVTCALTQWRGQVISAQTPAEPLAPPTAALSQPRSQGWAAQISAGGRHTCAKTTNGAVQCWGVNEDGQLGDGTTRSRGAPVTVRGLEAGVAMISAGLAHTCALLREGGVKCWGWNAFGQLGDGTTTDRLTPVDVQGLTNVRALSAGSYHTCAITEAIPSPIKASWTWPAPREYGPEQSVA